MKNTTSQERVLPRFTPGQAALYGCLMLGSALGAGVYFAMVGGLLAFMETPATVAGGLLLISLPTMFLPLMFVLHALHHAARLHPTSRWSQADFVLCLLHLTLFLACATICAVPYFWLARPLSGQIREIRRQARLVRRQLEALVNDFGAHLAHPVR